MELTLISKTRNETPLNLDSRYGSVDIVQALLDHGTDVNVPCKPFDTALMVASSVGKDSLVAF